MKFVYLIQLEGTDIYKVGFAKKVVDRIKTLQTGSPFKLIVVETYQSKRASKIEKVLHRTFNRFKIDENQYKLQGEFFQLDYQTRTSFLKECGKIDFNFQVIEENSTLNKF